MLFIKVFGTLIVTLSISLTAGAVTQEDAQRIIDEKNAASVDLALAIVELKEESCKINEIMRSANTLITEFNFLKRQSSKVTESVKALRGAEIQLHLCLGAKSISY